MIKIAPSIDGICTTLSGEDMFEGSKWQSLMMKFDDEVREFDGKVLMMKFESSTAKFNNEV